MLENLLLHGGFYSINTKQLVAVTHSGKEMYYLRCVVSTVTVGLTLAKQCRYDFAVPETFHPIFVQGALKAGMD